MADDELGPPRKGQGARGEETTQRFSALQQQLLCAAIHFFHRHIRSDPDVLQRMEGNQMFRLFYEVPYHNKPDLNRIFPDSVHDCSPLHVCSFILSILHQGIFSVSAFIVSVIYLSRFKESSHITLHACTWRPLFLTSLLLADKMWEDKPVRNSSLAKLFPVLSNIELNRMESEFLGEIRFNVLVKPDLFCSFCEKLLGEQVHQEILRCVSMSEYAATLQQDAVEATPTKAPSCKPMQVGHNGDVTLDTGGYYANGNDKGVAQSAQSRAAQQQHQQQQHQQPQQPPPQQSQSVQPQQSQHHGQRQQASAAWMEQNGPSPRGTAAAVPSASEGGFAPRSQSAGPPGNIGLRRDPTRPLGSGPHAPLHPGLAVPLRSSAGAAASAAAAQSKSSQQAAPGRSVSEHPLHRNESSRKSGKDELPEKLSRAGQPVASLAARAAQGPEVLRRSLPAKTTGAGYVPLPRSGVPATIAPPASSHGASSAVQEAASALVPPGSGGATVPAGGQRQPPQLSTSPRSPSMLPPEQHASLRSSSQAHQLAQAAAQQAAQQAAAQQLQAAAQQQAAAAQQQAAQQQAAQQQAAQQQAAQQQAAQQQAAQQQAAQQQAAQQQAAQQQAVQQQQQQQQSGVPPPQQQQQQQGQTSVQQQAAQQQQQQQVAVQQQPQQQQTASQQPASQQQGSQPAKVQQRVASPAGTAVQLTSVAQHPTRASSAPRVANLGNHHVAAPTGSNVRTSSQPMPAAAHHARQPQIYAPGSPSPSAPVVTATMGLPPGQQHYGHTSPVVFPASPAVRGTSPSPAAPMVQVGGGMQIPVSRGTFGGHSVNPVSLQAPSSPAGMVSMGQMFNSVSTTRGRSPAPTMAGPAAAPAPVRPRAVTPNSIVKGITQGIHAAGVVQRGSLGVPHMAMQRGHVM